MNDKLTAWFPLLLLAILAALTFWLDRAVQLPAGNRNELARHDPDYIVDNLSASSMAADGGIKNTLFATKMMHYPDDDSTYLQAPRLVSYSSGKAPITITSREALLSKDGEYRRLPGRRARLARRLRRQKRTCDADQLPACHSR